MKTIIFVVLLIASIERLQAKDVPKNLFKFSVPDAPEEVHEETQYDILIEEIRSIAKNLASFSNDVEKVFSPRSGGDSYGYDPDSELPPNRWSEKWPTCAGIRQSPINLDLSSCQKDLSGSPLKFYNFERRPLTTYVENLGHTIQISFRFNKHSPYITRGKFNSERYDFAQLHFHFGETDEVGSEHTLNSQSSSLELHLVFYKSTYGDTSTASQYTDGLVVVAFLFQASDDVPNKLFAQNLSRVTDPGNSVTVNSPKGNRLIDFVGSLNFEYAMYYGSLTTPPCSEAVTWYVSTNVQEMSRGDLEGFRSVMGEEGSMGGNNRPTQPINSRVCYVR
ncbi:carbonic anhydrase 1-like [Phlebotomus papatasi]|uniref:carbonic anhydrase 1-like n=1 Tax=Phlebotomus papatasi TaxID=29031 RepID=UPI00248459F9|nr:carbonic anhydrase 1-like [Phlebotomus papatasi]